MMYRLLLQIFFATMTIVYGNLFWYLFVSSLQSEHLLTDSPVTIVLSFLTSILILSIYFTLLLHTSLYVRKRLLWFVIALCSFLIYPFLLNLSALSVIGELVLSCAMYFLCVSFRTLHLVNQKKDSLMGKTAVSLSGISMIVTLVIVVNFYSFYAQILTSTNELVSHRVLLQSFSPLIRLYLQDLQVKNLDDSFTTYLAKRSLQTHIPAATLRQIVLNRLNLNTVSNSETMRNVLLQAVSQSMTTVLSHDRKQLSLLISLGLGAITQTLLTASIGLSSLLTYCLHAFLTRKGLLRKKERSVVLTDWE